MLQFARQFEPDAEAFIANLRRSGTPRRAHFIELYLDGEVIDEICRRYDIGRDLRADDPHFAEKRYMTLQRFLGYDYVGAGVGLPMVFKTAKAQDTAGLTRASGRDFVDEKTGPITCWEDFEKYPWPDPHKADTAWLEFFENNLPDDMCVIGGGVGHYAEHLSWLMGYETLCYALADQRDLVRAIVDKSMEMDRAIMRQILQFSRVKAVWGSDDMGFKTGTLISPDDLREFVLPGHRKLAGMAHDAGRLYILHSCGNLRQIMGDLIDDVKLDGKHSYEDVILPPTEAKRLYGDRLAILGGIDVDFLCRSDEAAIRRRVRETLDTCMPGGGYCLGSGNTVANYIPVDNYLAMMDEGRNYR
jgi:uroporphyrinogen decarboxylase